MKNKFVSLLAIILGIIIIAFPMIGVIGTSSLIGLSVLFNLYLSACCRSSYYRL